LLVALTIVTGLVDAFSYLTLGHVFVANMTGNVVFFGFALAGVGGISVIASLTALVAFAVGAVIGGRLAQEPRPHRGLLLAATRAVQGVLVLAAAILTTAGNARTLAAQLVLIAMLAIALGGQNAVVRRLGVPDLTTTVLTLTVTGLVADSSSGAVRLRRAQSLLAMLSGALLGGVLLRWTVDAAPLWVATGLLAACAGTAYLSARSPRSSSWR
jgi:uncharacterized membrane protein YoaK (UPF0700 family)